MVSPTRFSGGFGAVLVFWLAVVETPLAEIPNYLESKNKRLIATGLGSSRLFLTLLTNWIALFL